MSNNILIVDDCRTTRNILTCMIRMAGHKPLTAVNGLDALEKLAQNDIALVVTDLNMPQMDGLELVRHLRGNINYETLPIIMLSTESEERDKALGMEAGVDAYMTKPVTSESLAVQMAKLL